MRVFEASCHCGAIGVAFRSLRKPESWPVRACQCGFCRRHGARTTSDPAGAVALRIGDESKLQRYRFGLRTADFLICRTCGVYIAAMLTTARGRFATVNIGALNERVALPEPTAVSYEEESLEHRQQRRESAWTPVVDAI